MRLYSIIRGYGRHIALLTFSLVIILGCGGGGPTNPVIDPPALPPPVVVVDPRTTAEWSALIARLDIRIRDDEIALFDHFVPEFGTGNYYRNARSIFISYSSSYWDFAYSETRFWSNESSVTFQLSHAEVLLNDYREQWVLILDDYLENGILQTSRMDRIIAEIRPAMIASIDSGYENTIVLLVADLDQ